ncbi:TolC family protein [Methylocucumis oryzae]|uniref:TolC family protein n=1 Tax=Methylocucumis oryzae TaxID=1632867 RepID=UPI000696488D|nr:TolC family protein [Methylocucumis oryzae]
MREQIAAYQEIIASQAQQLAVTEQQFDLGGTSQAEVLAQQSSLEQFRANLPPLQLELEQTRHQLATLIGQSADKPLTEQFKLSDLQLPQQLPLSLPSKTGTTTSRYSRTRSAYPCGHRPNRRCRR